MFYFGYEFSQCLVCCGIGSDQISGQVDRGSVVEKQEAANQNEADGDQDTDGSQNEADTTSFLVIQTTIVIVCELEKTIVLKI